MKPTLIILPLLAIILNAPAFANDKHQTDLKTDRLVKSGHQEHKHAPIKLAQTSAEMADGEIKRISKGAKKLTIKHGEIKNLDMPPMTMVFSVSDEKMLDMVKKGDKVKFKAESINGQMVVTEITPN